VAALLPDPEDQRFLRRLVYVILALSICAFIFAIRDLLLLAFGATLGGLLLSAIADGIHARTRLPRSIGLAGATVLVLLVLGAIGWLWGDAIASQAQSASENLPKQLAALEQRLDASAMGRTIVDSARHAGSGGKLVALGLGAGWSAAELAVNFILILIGAIFFAADPGLYGKGIVLLTPSSYRPSIERALGDTASALRRWLLTQGISMALMGAMIAFGLWLSGVSNWAALGVLGGLSEFVPYVGPTVAMIPALLAPLIGDGSVWGVLATYALVRLVQANLITPLISQRVVKVPAGLYLFGIIAMGAAFSTFGLFFSGALVVAAYTLVRALYLRETLGER
jgi:predicted PurR-regulated permease PerM